MKRIVIAVMFVLAPLFSHAEEKVLNERVIIYDQKYGGKAVGRVEKDGTIYDQKYGGRVVGKIERDGTVKDEKYGGRNIGRIEAEEHSNEED